MSILVTGSLAIDRIMVFEDRFDRHILADKIHTLNVAFNVPRLASRFGGTAGNIAYGLKCLGAEPWVLGTAGEDFAPYEAWLDELGIRRDAILRLDGVATAQAFIITDLGHNQIIAFHEGAMARAHEATLASVPGRFEIGIVSSNGKRAMVELARELKQRDVRTVIDPSHGLPLFDRAELVELIEDAFLYVVNDYEWALTLQHTELSEGALVERVGGVVVTRGEKGSTLLRREGALEIPPVRADTVVDPTGCGDAYRAGLLAGIERGLPLDVAGRMGSLMGALNVARDGAQNLDVDADRFRERFQREFGITLE